MNKPINHTVIYEGKRPAFVVVPYDKYTQLLGDDAVLIPHDVN